MACEKKKKKGVWSCGFLMQEHIHLTPKINYSIKPFGGERGGEDPVH